MVENIFFSSHIEREIINTPTHIPKKQESKKINDKIITTKKINGEPAYINIKIICVNIASKLESKKFILEENPDLFCLQETHMFNENFKTIQE